MDLGWTLHRRYPTNIEDVQAAAQRLFSEKAQRRKLPWGKTKNTSYREAVVAAPSLPTATTLANRPKRAMILYNLLFVLCAICGLCALCVNYSIR